MDVSRKHQTLEPSHTTNKLGTDSENVNVDAYLKVKPKTPNIIEDAKFAIIFYFPLHFPIITHNFPVDLYPVILGLALANLTSRLALATRESSSKFARIPTLTLSSPIAQPKLLNRVATDTEGAHQTLCTQSEQRY